MGRAGDGLHPGHLPVALGKRIRGLLTDDKPALQLDRSALDLDDLLFQVSYLVEEFAPMERDLIEGFRVTRYSFK